MIWSVVPEEAIFPMEEDYEGKVQQHYGRQILSRQGRIECLLSTDPADYLDERFKPGTYLNKR